MSPEENEGAWRFFTGVAFGLTGLAIGKLIRAIELLLKRVESLERRPPRDPGAS